MNKKIVVLCIALSLSVLSACTQTEKRPSQQLVVEADPVALRLAAAVDRASTALQTLASIEQARNPGTQIESVSDAPQELRRIVSVNWSGPLVPILERLADRAGYRMMINGYKLPVPIIVSVRSREKTIVEVLRDLGLQAGKRAEIIVDPDNKVLELNYASVID